MPAYIKISALAVSIAGLTIAMELASLTSKQVKTTPNLSLHHFSNMLGFYPAVVHRLAPKLMLTIGQSAANLAIDQTWLEKVGPKTIGSCNSFLAATTSNLQQGIIKTYLMLFFISLALVLLTIT